MNKKMCIKLIHYVLIDGKMDIAFNIYLEFIHCFVMIATIFTWTSNQREFPIISHQFKRRRCFSQDALQLRAYSRASFHLKHHFQTYLIVELFFCCCSMMIEGLWTTYYGMVTTIVETISVATTCSLLMMSIGHYRVYIVLL